MKYIKTLVGALVATALLATAVSAAPSTNAPVATPSGDLGSWTLSLAGAGSINTQEGEDLIGAEFQIGHSAELILPAEVGVRQGIGWTSADDNNWAFSTRVYSDWQLVKLGNLQLDVGGNVGIEYGNTTLTWVAGPEVVARLYLKKDVDTFVRAQYDFDLNTGKSRDNVGLTLGVRVRF